MKRKAIFIVLSLVCAVFCVIGLGSCGLFGNSHHEHQWSSTWSYDDTYHWYACSGCSEKLHKSEHSFNNDICIICDARDTSILKYRPIDNNAHYEVYGVKQDDIVQIEIPSIYLGKPVTRIADSAFYNSKAMTSITIPDSVTEIGIAAFAYTGLQQISLPNSITKIESSAFEKCESMQQISLPNGLTEISYETFSECTSLERISIPDSVKRIGSRAFYNCRNLQEIDIPDSITAIEESAFAQCANLHTVIIPDSVTQIGDRAFADTKIRTATLSTYAAARIPTTYLETVMLTSGKDIESKTFSNCPNLSSVTLPDELQTIGNNAFTSCAALTEISLPDTVTTIGESAFQSCTALKKIDLSARLAKIGNNAFSDCAALDDFTFPETVSVIGNNAFADCTALTAIALPNNLADLGIHAFARCTALKSISVPDGITNWFGVTSGCSSLTSITLPDSITGIGLGSFRDCTALEEISLPFLGENRDDYTRGKLYYSFSERSQDFNAVPESLHSVTLTSSTGLSGDAFIGGSRLTDIILNEGLTYIGQDAFRSCRNLVRLSIPNSLETIKDTITSGRNTTFENCSELRYNRYDNADYLGNADNPYVILVRTYKTTATTRKIPRDTRTMLYYSLEVPTKLKTVSIFDGELPAYAFKDCMALQEINLPDTLKSIGDHTFDGCRNLDEITIPKNVTSIGYGAFGDCWNLVTVTIPDSLTFLGSDAFYNCSKLTYNRQNDIKYLGNSANPYVVLMRASTVLNQSVSVPDTTNIIYQNAFLNCSSLVNITLPESVTQIGYAAFSGCTNLKTVNIPDKVTIIYEQTFQNCKNLQSIVLPSGLTAIGTAAFKNCSALTRLHIPASVNYIADKTTSPNVYEFINGCNALVELTVDPNNKTYIGKGNCIIEWSTNRLLYGCMGSVIPDDGSVTTIRSCAFYCCPITEITIPNSVTTIEYLAFFGCKNLTSVFISKNVKYIEHSAFFIGDGNDVLTLYCEATNKPQGWADQWNFNNTDFSTGEHFYYNVVWGYKINNL